MIDWDDPVARAELIERVGPSAYNKAFAEHRKSSIVASVNGHDIWPTTTRFGRLFVVGGTDMAFRSLDEAKGYAAKLTEILAV